MKKEDIEKIIEEYKNITEKECYEIICEEGTPDILDDKIGGIPYIPVGEEYPTDAKGNPLALLIQVNLENIHLPGYPEKGTLEIFTDKDVNYPCEYAVKYFVNNKEYQTNLPNVSLENYITTRPIKISLKRNICHMPVSDYRFYDVLGDIVNKVCGLNIQTTEELEKLFDDFGGIYETLGENITVLNGTIGGYADFTQMDPRKAMKENFDECLVKIDSCLHDDIMIGDTGIISAIISEENTYNLDFEEAIVDWDCL